MNRSLAPGEVAYFSVFLQDRKGAATGRSVMYRISAGGAAKILDYECEAVTEDGKVVGYANAALRRAYSRTA